MTIEFAAERSARKTLSINFQRIWVVIFKNERRPTEPFPNILLSVVIRRGSKAVRQTLCGILGPLKGEKPHFVFSSTLSPVTFLRELIPHAVSLFYFIF